LDFALAIGLLPIFYPVFWIHYFLLTPVALLVSWKVLLTETKRRTVRIGILLTAVYLLAGIPLLHAARWYLDKEADLLAELAVGRFLYSSILLILSVFLLAMSQRESERTFTAE
jgi:hypothetical protein